MRTLPALPLLVTLACLGACGPDPGTTTPGDITTDTAPDAAADVLDDAAPDTTADDAEDAAGDLGAAETDTSASGCSAVGRVCDPLAPSGDGLTCVPEPSGGGTCRRACDPVAADACGTDEACLAPAGADVGYCVPKTCAAFGDCGAGAKCLASGGAGTCVVAEDVPLGLACDVHEDCARNALCFGGRCALAGCDPFGAGECPLGAACREVSGPAGTPLDVGVCDASCAPFALEPSCPAGTWCRPAAGTEVGVCVETSAANAGPGEPCSVGSCCAAADTPGCPADPDVESCVCAEDAFCCDAAGEWDETCAGLAVSLCGASCEAPADEACGEGLACVAGACRPICLFGADGWSCGVGEACLPVFADGSPSPWGTCASGCEPFTSDPTCGATHWCRPLYFGGGACQPIADSSPGLGGSCGALDITLPCCDPAGGCADAPVRACACAADPACCDGWGEACVAGAVNLCGASCSELWQSCDVGLVCLSDRCERACLPAAPTGQPGACPSESDACRTLEAGGTPLAFGACRQVCDFAAGEPCAHPEQFCAAAAVLGQPQDLCVFEPVTIPGFPLAAGAPCPAAAGTGTFCAPNRLCVAGACKDLCLAATAPLATKPHPDCTVPGEACQPLGEDVGLCD